MKSALLTAVLLVVSSAAVPAAPGTITATVTPAGPFAVGDSFTVTLRLSGYTNVAPIDAYQFKISYPAALLTFTGPFSHGTSAPGPAQQWLSMPGQESLAAGYAPAAADDSSVPGSLLIDYADLGYSDPEGGTTAAGGFIVSFPMRALAPGTGSITPVAPPGGVTFLDTDFNPAGSPAFTGVTITVGTPDTDGDGLPDAWETAHGLDPNDNGSINPLNGPHGDQEGDGLTNLWELALGMDPRVHNAGVAPAVSIAVNPADGRPYLMLTWRRRIGGGGFTFTPLVSDDLVTWDSAPANFTEIAAAPSGDGLTETVLTRVLPSLRQAPRRQVRVRVSIP